jgi:hypothetical protein
MLYGDSLLLSMTKGITIEKHRELLGKLGQLENHGARCRLCTEFITARAAYCLFGDLRGEPRVVVGLSMQYSQCENTPSRGECRETLGAACRSMRFPFGNGGVFARCAAGPTARSPPPKWGGCRTMHRTCFVSRQNGCVRDPAADTS